MSDSDLILIFSFTSSGIQKTLWSFGSDPKSGHARINSPVHDMKVRLEGLAASSAGLTLAKGASNGTMETEAIEAPEFDWLVPWWNADTAGLGSLEIFLRAETAGGWSPWYSMGRWSRSSSSRSRGDEIAKIEADTLLLSARSGRFKLKLELSAGEGGTGAVILRRMGVISRDKGISRPPSRAHFLVESSIKIPPRSQEVEAEDIRGKICSPTCGAMALQYLGIDLPTAFVAADCWDAGAKIYGNWPFNIASLWRLGARVRFDFLTMEEASGELAAGHPFVASIRFSEGQLGGAPISKTNGHLVLVTGLNKDESGAFQVLANDPAAADPATVARRYKLEEFEKVWSGVAYVVEGLR